eukprot:GHVL01041669.1.p1 GENE.GHVL01041669.1~~GHVL01041669.1.p1  ORF type:complete len:396 (-),score=43.43 GHVL01041669.1:1102-2289(-)
MFKLQSIIEERKDELAKILSEEQGKTIADAKGDIFRGLEVVEHACSIPTIIQGETLDNVATSVDTYSFRQPLGVCGGICPFNFPVMIPLWMFPMAITTGNTFVLKPSERVPLSTMKLMEYIKMIDLPPGVVNVVHGGADTVNWMCAEPIIKTVSFVGSNNAGEHIYNTASKHGKRVQCNMGAKNHAVVLPDAAKDDTLNMICNAAFGAAGQRCMALSVVVLVGDAQNWMSDLVDRARDLKVDIGTAPDADIGPLISPMARERAVRIIREGAKHAEARLLLDGTDFSHPTLPNGNFMGPTILANVMPGNPAYDEEIFGPCLVTVNCETFQDAIDFVNQNQYGMTRVKEYIAHLCREWHCNFHSVRSSCKKIPKRNQSKSGSIQIVSNNELFFKGWN